MTYVPSTDTTSQWISQEKKKVINFISSLSACSREHTIPFKLNSSNDLLKPADIALPVSWKKRKPQHSHQPPSFLCSQPLRIPDNNDRKISLPSLPGPYPMLFLSHQFLRPQRPLCGNLQGSSGGNPELSTSSLRISRYSYRGDGCKSRQLWSRWLCSSPNRHSQTASPLYSCPRNVETNDF